MSKRKLKKKVEKLENQSSTDYDKDEFFELFDFRCKKLIAEVEGKELKEKPPKVSEKVRSEVDKMIKFIN